MVIENLAMTGKLRLIRQLVCEYRTSPTRDERTRSSLHRKLTVTGRLAYLLAMRPLKYDASQSADQPIHFVALLRRWTPSSRPVEAAA